MKRDALIALAVGVLVGLQSWTLLAVVQLKTEVAVMKYQINRFDP